MRFGIINDQRVDPMPKGMATCACCGKPLIAKCGNINIWHWSHFPKRHCDNWWENETEWHRKWKNYFPVANQEVVQFDEQTGEKHIADVKTPDGIVVELQNSPMKEMELLSRERFYQNMIWIVNGEPFKKQFFISPYRLPPPNSSLAKDLHIIQPSTYSISSNEFDRPIMVKKSKGVKQSYGTIYQYGGMAKGNAYDSTDEILNEIDQVYYGHHFFDWHQQREVWFHASRIVIIDFGEDIVIRLERFNKSMHCVSRWGKSTLIEALGGKMS